MPTNIAYIDGADMDQGAVLYLTLLPHGQTFRLDSMGRLIWTIATEGRDVVAGIAQELGQPVATIAPEVTAFLEVLVHRGLLTVSASETRHSY